mmetsp:Transcript_74955/g.211775  ORF Transcript_74955/g.211775 Transcript_74955/m.211775 type:complete len:202 (-) Transcript_74955:20-625(-)
MATLRGSRKIAIQSLSVGVLSSRNFACSFSSPFLMRGGLEKSTPLRWPTCGILCFPSLLRNSRMPSRVSMLMPSLPLCRVQFPFSKQVFISRVVTSFESQAVPDIGSPFRRTSWRTPARSSPMPSMSTASSGSPAEASRTNRAISESVSFAGQLSLRSASCSAAHLPRRARPTIAASAPMRAGSRGTGPYGQQRHPHATVQ